MSTCPICHQEIEAYANPCPHCGSALEWDIPVSVTPPAEQTMSTRMPQELDLNARRLILDQEIAKYSRRGYRIINRTDINAQLMRPKSFSCLWATLWFLLFGIGLLIYVFYYMSKKDEMVYIEVDPFGRIHRR